MPLVASLDSSLSPFLQSWVSEWGPLVCSGRDLELALYMARTIIESVNIMGASAWVYWQVRATSQYSTLYCVLNSVLYSTV